MKKSGKEHLKKDNPNLANRLPRLESLLRHEIGNILERELELPPDTLLTISAVEVLPDLSQARIGVSILPTEKAGVIFKLLLKSAAETQRLINQKLRLYRVPKLYFYLDHSLAEVDRLERLLDTLKKEE